MHCMEGPHEQHDGQNTGISVQHQYYPRFLVKGHALPARYASRILLGLAKHVMTCILCFNCNETGTVLVLLLVGILTVCWGHVQL